MVAPKKAAGKKKKEWTVIRLFREESRRSVRSLEDETGLMYPTTGHDVIMKSVLLTLPSRDPFDADPPEDEHGAVMVDVEEADLVELLPQDEKDCVQELHSFGDVVPPQSRCYLKTSEPGKKLVTVWQCRNLDLIFY